MKTRLTEKATKRQRVNLSKRRSLIARKNSLEFDGYHHKKSTTAQTKAIEIVIRSVSDNGVVYGTGDQQIGVGFRVEKLQGYAGESFEEIGLQKGATVRVVVRAGKVLTAALKHPA